MTIVVTRVGIIEKMSAIFVVVLSLFALLLATQSSYLPSQSIKYRLEASPRPWRWYMGTPVSPKLPEHYDFQGKNQELIIQYDKLVTYYLAQKAYVTELCDKASTDPLPHDCMTEDNFTCLACEITIVVNQLTVLEDRIYTEFGDFLEDIRWYYFFEAMRGNAALKKRRDPSEVLKFRMIRKRANARSTVASNLLKKYRPRIPDQSKIKD
jgi:hypothetical protein